LDCDKLPEYDTELLAGDWDKLITQYDEIEGTHLFESLIDDIEYEVEGWNEIVILKAHYGLLRIGRLDRVEELQDFGIDILGLTKDSTNIPIELIQRVRSEIMKRYTRIEIDEARSGEEHKKKGGDYIESVVYLSHVLAPQIIDPMTITVTRYIQLNKLAKKLTSAKTQKAAWDK
jgi:hypothetical protein